jgi:hypothetical protein
MSSEDAKIPREVEEDQFQTEIAPNSGTVYV